ncbi:Ubiquitin--protein ligase [Bertholletia excelsa]
MEAQGNGLESSYINEEIEEIKDEIDQRFRQFKKFDVIGNPPFDHNFFYTNRCSSKCSFAEKIKQEWSTLETSLPDSIFVRAYENRIDLMRAVLIGPPETPYNHGLFFFDILFPDGYPSRPPKVFYCSHGIDLNPLLGKEGKVYLSLLDACWYQCCCLCRSETWNPKKSNILHVLESIHGQILNIKPYLDGTSGFSCSLYSGISKYNGNAFGLTCEAMIHVLKSPPRNFEDFVAGHFRQRAHPILLAFREGAEQSECTRQLFLKLLNAFESNGAYCKHHLFWARSEEENTDDRSTNKSLVTCSNNLKKSGNL